MYVCKSIQLLATNMRQPRDVYHRGYYYMHLYACMYGTYVRIYTCIQLVLQWSETCKHGMYVYMVCMCMWYVCTITLNVPQPQIASIHRALHVIRRRIHIIADSVHRALVSSAS